MLTTIGRLFLAIAIAMDLVALIFLAIIAALALGFESWIDRSAFAGARFGDRLIYPQLVATVMLTGFGGTVFSVPAAAIATFLTHRAAETWFFSLGALVVGLGTCGAGLYLLVD